MKKQQEQYNMNNLSEDEEKYIAKQEKRLNIDYLHSYRLLFKLMLLLNSGGIIILTTGFIPRITGNNIYLYIIFFLAVIMFVLGLIFAFYVAIKDFLLYRKDMNNFVDFRDQLTDKKIDYNKFCADLYKSEKSSLKEYDKTVIPTITASFIFGSLGVMFLILLTSILIFSH